MFRDMPALRRGARLRKRLAAAMLISVAAADSVNADYNDNLVVRITQVLTYDSGMFLIMTDRTPVAACRDYFIVPTSVASDARQMLLSRALVAKSTGEAVNIGFDNKTCINGWYLLHRIG